MALFVRFGRKPSLAWLDGEIAKIRQELDTAHQLRAEAEVALAQCKKKQTDAEAEAQAILTTAKRRVEALRKNAEDELAATLAHHEELAAERIRMAEVEAIALVRSTAIDLAVSLARQTLTEKLSETDAARLIDLAIADMPSFGDSKAKAA